jgi:uncharacterized protein YbaP (TraB family)
MLSDSLAGCFAAYWPNAVGLRITYIMKNSTLQKNQYKIRIEGEKMRHTKRIICIIGIVLILIPICGCSDNRPTPLFYIITDSNQNNLYLFGTVHMANDRSYPLRQEIIKALENSDTLSVEADITKPQKESQVEGTSALYTYNDQKTIKDEIGEDLYSRVVAVINAEVPHFDISQYDNYRPFVWQSLLQNIAMVKSDFSMENGIDIYLLNKAKESGKKIQEIESVTIRYERITSLSPQLNRYLLEQALNIDLAVKDLESTYEVWSIGDEKRFEEFEEKIPDVWQEKSLYNEYLNKVLYERNTRMTGFIEQQFAEGNTTFVAVGVAHLIGEKGIVSQLRELGYTVEKVRYS